MRPCSQPPLYSKVLNRRIKSLFQKNRKAMFLKRHQDKKTISWWVSTLRLCSTGTRRRRRASRRKVLMSGSSSISRRLQRRSLRVRRWGSAAHSSLILKINKQQKRWANLNQKSNLFQKQLRGSFLSNFVTYLAWRLHFLRNGFTCFGEGWSFQFLTRHFRYLRLVVRQNFVW